MYMYVCIKRINFFTGIWVVYQKTSFENSTYLASNIIKQTVNTKSASNSKFDTGLHR